jgi:hypothetical protein
MPVIPPISRGDNVIARRLPRLAGVGAAAFVTVSSTVVTAVTTAVAGAAPAMAISDRGDSGGGLSGFQTAAIYLGIPVATAAVLAFLVYLPSLVSGPRYRPGRQWSAPAVWFGAPTGDAAAAEAAAAAVAVSELAPATALGGGASARW